MAKGKGYKKEAKKEKKEHTKREHEKMGIKKDHDKC